MSFGSGFEDELLRQSLSGGSPATSTANPDFERHKALGNAAFNEQDYGSALVHYSAASEADPFSPVPVANRAMVYLKMKEWELAEKEAGRALALMGDGGGRLRVKVLLRRASAREGLGRIREAESDLDEVGRLESGNREARAIRERLASRGIHFIREVQLDDEITYGRGDGGPQRGVDSSGKAGRREKTKHIMTNGHHIEENDRLDVGEAVRAVRNRLVRQRPTTSSEFDRMWRSLRDDDTSRGHYLVMTVGKEGIEQDALGMNITAQFLMEAIVAMKAFLEGSMNASAVRAAEVLLAFKNVPRFRLILAFLNRSDIDYTKSFVQYLFDKGCGEPLASQLRDMF